MATCGGSNEVHGDFQGIHRLQAAMLGDVCKQDVESLTHVA